MSSQEVSADTVTSDSQETRALLDALSNPRRRHLIHALSEQPGPVTVDTLAEAVHRREADAGETTHPEQIAISLHHLHLPKLDSREFLDYHPARKEVVPTHETDDASYALVSAGFHD
ncbi:hypothetical protein AUR64_09490 [Haloprofundus marisrubri]|uniref:DUF7344 domain-containing protein n=1 Tax=Haloprofundus marisrubri TaxID=1514971 RepID=A0A0W1R8S2_9EURY|nr:hypothetical protein [Haloprofundus marisrubri]KTG09852.1 hypothetical protein AUR64_09490 [Haloprofundus marisrubri]